MDDNDFIKYKISHLYNLCNQLYPDEFKKIFYASRNAFRKWLNKKTGLKADHIKEHDVAIDSWIEALQEIKRLRG